jgi:hypothetical protein
MEISSPTTTTKNPTNKQKQNNVVHLGDNCIVFENFTASIGDLMIAN